ncbi:MAG: MFS transporter [Pseudomonadota bacterium]
MQASSTKPRLSFWQLWNMSFGFFGIQFGFALQTANTSRIFSTLGAELDSLAILWLAAPLTGMLVQPIIGHLSDHTWDDKWGRRRPFFFVGAILASLALVLMPNSTVLWMAVLVLWLMDVSINISMEPFRAFVGDKLNASQQTAGFAMQTFFIGCGGVIASLLPTIFTDYLGVSNQAIGGAIPDTVRYSYYVGATAYALAVMWTVFSSDEIAPVDKAQFQRDRAANMGMLKTSAAILRGFVKMPKTMLQLALVQFFSWVALYAMWVYTTPSVADNVFHTVDGKSAAFQDGGNWVGIMFAVYGGVSALAAFVLPVFARHTSRKTVHMVCLIIGGLSLASISAIGSKQMMLAPMIGVGIAWASILTMPYAILAGSLPPSRMGYYMGLFNFFIVAPQIVAGLVLGPMVKYLFASRPVGALVIGGTCMVLAGLFSHFITDNAEAAE